VCMQAADRSRTCSRHRHFLVACARCVSHSRDNGRAIKKLSNVNELVDLPRRTFARSDAVRGDDSYSSSIASAWRSIALLGLYVYRRRDTSCLNVAVLNCKIHLVS
jgi:hypothetical protein